MDILIVDDHATNRKLLRAQLEAEGHVILEAADGVEALGVLERESVDGVVSDILMPNMDGYRFCREVRQNARFSALPFIFYTSSFDSVSDRQLAEAVGADDYFLKPSSPADLLHALLDATQKLGVRDRQQSQLPDEIVVLSKYSDVLVASSPLKYPF